VKATQKNFAGTAARAARECRVFYFCGPDEAGAGDAAQKIAGLLGEAERSKFPDRS
jgi:DNA polymerase-3 subunit delta